MVWEEEEGMEGGWEEMKEERDQLLVDWGWGGGRRSLGGDI